MTDDRLMLDKQHLRAAFERAATSYDEVAVLQRSIAETMLARLDIIRFAPDVVLDVGCGTGHVAQVLRRRYPRARLLAVDLAQAMTRRARTRLRRFGLLPDRRAAYICADTEALPFADASMDMIVSNLTLQWCSPARTFAEWRRVLRPGGLLMFASFGPDTLAELRTAWSAVDSHPHVHGFPDIHDLGDELVRAGFADPVLDIERFVLTYPDVSGVLRDIKLLGAHNATRDRSRGLTGKLRFAAFQAAYERQRIDGRLPATYEAIYAHAWMPMTSRVTGGVARIPLAMLRGRSS